MVTDADVQAIPGWFGGVDVAAFRVLLDATAEHLGGGDLAELGVYLGKSAVLIGGYRKRDERFTVIDLFGDAADEDANLQENRAWYPNLTRRRFEEFYLNVHRDLPTVIQGPSGMIVDHAPHSTHRFVHIDASHLYEHVVRDIEAAKTLLMPEGVVVLDDYRSEPTPGVAAAAWHATAQGMRPFLLTPAKMYATWGDATRWREAIARWLATNSAELHERHVIAGDEVIRVWSRPPRLARYVPPVAVPTLARLRARLRAPTR